MSRKLTLTVFAKALGQTDRATLTQSAPLHTAYAKAKPELRTEMRHDFIVAYIMGVWGCAKMKAEKVTLSNRKERSKPAQRVYDLARKKFAYHIERTVATQRKAAKRKSKGTIWGKIERDAVSVNEIKRALRKAEDTGRAAQFHKALRKLISQFK